MRAYERLLKYVKIHTTSDDACMQSPSTQRQFDLAKILVEEMLALGIKDARVDEKCCVYGSIPATKGCESAPAIGLIAHMDTSPDFNGENVNPQLIENYNGEDIVLGNSGRVLSTKQFPHLKKMMGRTLITTDGTSLLGADDKAGIAEILTAVEEINASDMPHGKICIAFTPDEEVGRGADAVDVATFGADYAYTLDGGVEGEITYETFNACAAHIVIHGFNVHPGSSKNVMINALLVAMEFNQMLPGTQTPAQTEGYEGFYHLTDLSGNVEKAEMSYIIRDHSEALFESKKATIHHIEKIINERYGEGTVEVTLKDQYKNMDIKIKEAYHLITNACQAAAAVGLEPIITPIRGGTDGAILSFRGLPCPDIGTGGFAYHGPYEHITVEGMDQTVALILELLSIYAKDGAIAQ